MIVPDLRSIDVPPDLPKVLESVAAPQARPADVSVPDDAGRPVPGRRSAWNRMGLVPRCDFAPDRHAVVARHPDHFIHPLWRRSPHGQTLTGIKEDPDMVGFFADSMVRFISRVVGPSPDPGSWALAVPPARRHPDRNFASLVGARIAADLGIPFAAGLAGCSSRQRVGAEFGLLREPPEQRNILLFDDIVTTGSTILAMYRLLVPMGYTLVSFAAINNKK